LDTSTKAIVIAIDRGSGAGMADVTIQVLQGLEAGAILRQLPTPITIGREEENLVQLNDERISRFPS